MTIAVIEDDEGMRDSLCVVLEVHGFPARSYASAEAFLDDPLGRVGLGCVVVDQHLEHTTGLELIRQLAASGNPPPCILISAKMTPPLALNALAAGALAALGKPILPDRLLELVAQAVGGIV